MVPKEFFLTKIEESQLEYQEVMSLRQSKWGRGDDK